MTNQDHPLDFVSPLNRKRKITLPWVIGCTVVLCICIFIMGGVGFLWQKGAVMAALFPTDTPTQTSTQTRTATNTPTITPTLTNTPIPPYLLTATAGTITAQARATHLAAQRITGTAKVEALLATQAAAEQIEQEFINALGQDLGEPFFGPRYGSILHDPTNDWIELYDPEVWLKNFVLAVTFFVPYASSLNPWDFGVIFRDNSLSNYRLVISSGGNYDLIYYHEDQWEFLVSGYLSGQLNLSAGQMNWIILGVIGSYAELHVNGSYIDAFDVSHKVDWGSLTLGTGMFTGGELAGEQTDFTGFLLWKVEG
jgi:hypothetical protein